MKARAAASLLLHECRSGAGLNRALSDARYSSDATANRRWRGRPLFARCGSELSSGGDGYERHNKPAAPKLQAPPAEAALRCLVT